MSWRVAKSLETLRSQVNARWPKRHKENDGTIGDAAHASRSSDHNPWVKDGSMGVVTACDITNDPADGCDAGLLASVLLASRDPRIKYVIWNRQITAGSDGPSPWVPRKYTGSNPHDHHCHISVKASKSFYDDTREWAMPGSVQPPVIKLVDPQPTELPTITLHSTGDAVRTLQKLLGIEVDGMFGPKTQEAVKQYQAKAKLVVDGKVGPYTWAALKK